MRSDKSTDGQGRTFTEQARRSQIVECAIATMTEFGYVRSSLAEIAKRAGISKGVIAYHFANKDELTEQVVFELYRRAGQLIGTRVEKAPTAASALQGYLEVNLAFIQGNPDLVRVLTDIVMNFRDENGHLRYGPDDADGLLQHLEGILRRGQETGEFRDFSTRPMAIVIRAAIDAASGRISMDPHFDIGAYTSELITMFDLATAKGPR
ncbi:TetR/AcrR family transcriptional regulator [Haloactinomyces albus]|uniref:AcrR family transcriptional regulator n=1 Tax=Haloactinomyces albus TaxID=1352928 RepID=A0AAE3ZG81_9ACTN|nr:TetR/AcrR family transcriptional regulator [Haloactinomyces albus]MDR7302974.1 AcrR family transcriptional regulator [Haloactinomyces albus]